MPDLPCTDRFRRFLQFTPARTACSCDQLRQFGADGICKADVRHKTVTEEGRDSGPGSIEELIRDNEV